MKITTEAQVTRAPPGVHKVADVTGLYLKVGEAPSTSGSWFVRYRLADRRREFGLGSRGKVSLVEASKEARAAFVLIDKGIDPIDAKRAERAENIAKSRTAAQGAVTFEKMVEAYLAAHAGFWKHRYARSVWLGPVKNYAFPIIGKLTLSQITIGHVIEVIERAERAGAPMLGRRAQASIERVLNAQIALSGAAIRNPADLKLIKAARPMRRKGEQPHFRSVGIKAGPEIFRQLKALMEAPCSAADANAIAAWVLMALCALRPSEALGAQWGEIKDEALWVIPAARMKGAKEHIVPLSQAALAVLERQTSPSIRTGDSIFPGRGGSPVSYTTFTAAPLKLGVDAASPHGWRSIFKGWAGNVRDDVPHELSEVALAHSLNKVEAAYWRGSPAVERRRKVMENYAAWLNSDEPKIVVLDDHRASRRKA